MVIKNLQEVLQPHLPSNYEVADFKTARLTSPGENYGSQMLAVTLTIQNALSFEKRSLNLVAKMCPPTQFLKELFDVNISFKKEISVYTKIIPTLREFQKSQGVTNLIECFPLSFGARLSLNSDSDYIDDDAILLMENLKLSGYAIVDQMKGFDFDTTQLILEDLATFHAVPTALKILKPNLFEKHILPHLKGTRVFDNMSEKMKIETLRFLVESVISRNEVAHLRNHIENCLKQSFYNICNPPKPREPFATIIHNDFWVNNTMIKFENGKPIKNKMLDFQLLDYDSPGKDIIFFLFTSVQPSVLKRYDELIKIYYNKFISTLKELKCDTSPFTFQAYQEELHYAASTTEFFHIMIMLKHILANKDRVKELDTMCEEDLISEVQVSQEFKQKALETVLEFINRKWI